MTNPTPIGSTPSSSANVRLRYVALGDSYTIGTSVAERDSWPSQLAAALDLAGATPTLDLVANLAVNGYTSRDVIEVQLPQLDALDPEFLSLLVGVNDVIQGVSLQQYREQVCVILDDLVGRVGAHRILVVTTPDYTVTPTGAAHGDPAARSAAIREANEALTAVARALDVATVDIYDVSLLAADDHSLVAGDGLHPSGAQYALWVQRILPTIRALLGPEARGTAGRARRS